ncbi:Ubiquinone biosynthesis protein coq9 [Paramecium bursaria]
MFSKPLLISQTILHAANHGFTQKAIQQACIDLNVSQAAATITTPIEVIHHAMKKWNSQIIDEKNHEDNFKDLKTTPKIKRLVKERLSLQIPYLNHWNQAMAIGAKHPAQTSQILWQYADDSWFLAGDKSQDYNFYTKRSLFLYVYISTELFMLTDKSPELFMTWEFMDRYCFNIQQIIGGSKMFRRQGSRANSQKNLGVCY